MKDRPGLCDTKKCGWFKKCGRKYGACTTAGCFWPLVWKIEKEGLKC